MGKVLNDRMCCVCACARICICKVRESHLSRKLRCKNGQEEKTWKMQRVRVSYFAFADILHVPTYWSRTTTPSNSLRKGPGGEGHIASVIMRAGRGRSLETDSMVVPPSSLPATGEMRKWWGP